MKDRVAYLIKHGRPWITIVYIGNHIFLYLGNYSNAAKASIPLTYQNIWALKPLDESRRSIIGKSVILPLVENYPEDPTLNSQANTDNFQMIFLDEWPDQQY